MACTNGAKGVSRTMNIQDAKSFVGMPLRLTWTGRKGDEQTDLVYVFNVGFVPLYGPCLITDKGEIRLDRVVHFESVVRSDNQSAAA
jgi:hypothetical protein